MDGNRPSANHNIKFLCFQRYLKKQNNSSEFFCSFLVLQKKSGCAAYITLKFHTDHIPPLVLQVQYGLKNGNLYSSLSTIELHLNLSELVIL